MMLTNHFKMAWRTLFLLFIISYPLASPAQNKTPDCAAMKNGIFYACPKNSGFHYVLYRDGDSEKEVNLTHHDSTVWKVQWKDDCTYILKYLSGNTKMTDEMAVFLKKHVLAYKIGSVAEDYYTYSEYIDKPSGTLLETDTVWTQERQVVSNNALFRQIADNSVLRKLHFSDTSKYAVLYLYRPGKLALSLSPFLVYLDDNLLAVMKNKSGHLFVVLKKGQLTIKSKLNKDEYSLPVNIQFGKKYYIRSTLNWGIHLSGNSKLALELVSETEGKNDFEAVQ